jgi:uncharacterized membrane protein
VLEKVLEKLQKRNGISLAAFWEQASSSYWFVPSLMVTGAIALSFAVIGADAIVGPGWLEDVGWLFANKPDGARELLGTIAGSIIGVAGVSFSITIATFAQSTSQFGPRLITNFMRDRGNQIVLGTFVGTFVYCLMVLRTIQGADQESAAFVPHIAIVVALVLALCSVGVLIYFIHHIPESINISNVLARIGRELAEQLQQQPSEDMESALPPDFPANSVAIASRHSGYVQHVEVEKLLKAASNLGVLVALEREPGDFVAERAVLARLWPAVGLEEHDKDGLRAAFLIGNGRSPTQDILFLVDEIVEIAARALSPGVNDVFTALSGVDWLENALRVAAQHEIGGLVRRDSGGQIRIVGRRFGFCELLARISDQLRPYVARDRNAALHFMAALEHVAPLLPDYTKRAALLEAARSLHRGAVEKLAHPDDGSAVDQALRRVEVATKSECSNRMS